MAFFSAVAVPFNATYSHLDLSCNGAMDGHIDTVSVVGGLQPYTFKKVWNHGTDETTITSFPVTGLIGDTFVMIAFDSQLNSDTDTIIILEPNFLTMHIDWMGSICNGDNANLRFQGYGGTLPYTYFFSHPSDSILFVNDTEFVVLPQPDVDYTFTIKDANGCNLTNHLNEHPAYLYVEEMGYISGYIMDESNYAPLTDNDTLWLSLIQISPISTVWTTIDSIPFYGTGNDTYYYFDSIQPGKYILLAKYDTSIINGINYAPTYSGNVFNWTEADTIEISSGCEFEYKEIEMIKSTPETEGGSIEGYLYILDFVFKTEDSGDPVPLIDIVVEKDSVYQNSVQAHITSFNTHLYSYKFDNLPDGQYTINVVVSGLSQNGFRYPVLSQANDSIVQQNFCVDLFNVGTIDFCSFTVENEQLDTSGIFTNVQNLSETLDWTLYPNPNTGNFQIQLPDAYQNFNTVKIFNSTGRLVVSNEMIGKDKTFNFSEKLSTGFYWIVLSDGQAFLRKGFSVD
jgi:hypothetical protein